MMVETISESLRNGRKICFAIARRQVVLELAQRLSEIFPSADIVPVCQGHTDQLTADLIVCTTHQLFRYSGSFQVLILDEPDAYPFKGSEILHGIAESACYGHTIFLTATPDDVLKQRVKEGSLLCLKLNQRPHGHPLPVPELKCAPLVIRMFLLIRWLRKHAGHPRMVFVPTIRMASQVYRFLRLFFSCYVCTSKTPDRDQVITSFRSEKEGIIVATTVLERGVTIPGADICVLQADSGVFDEASLVQMAGRAGRTFDHPDGDVLFLLKHRSRLAEACRDSIREANESCAV
ncbi:MAG: helicase-related protein [Bulleidia sp.]